jgi:peptidyl-prolyl cis-trans isomerase SurA
MAKVRSLYFGAASLLLAAFALPQTFVPAHAEQIAATVNTIVITSGDVAKRVKFLQLRGDRKGNLQQKAKQELVDEVLMRQEIIRTGTSVSTDDVEAAYERFAKNNKMSSAQLTQILTRAGVGPEHFKAYVGVSMSWPKTVAARFGGASNGRMTNDEFIAKLKANNGQKPTVTEYVIQQVIFVIPDKKRNSITGKRKSEAEAARKSFPGCAQAKVFAAGFKDVSVRQQQRVLETQFPEEMKVEIGKLPEGGTTKVSVGPYGAEFYAVCKKRQVSDDLAAQVTYETQDLTKAEKEAENPNAKKYLEELRKQNDITIR